MKTALDAGAPSQTGPRHFHRGSQSSRIARSWLAEREEMEVRSCLTKPFRDVKLVLPNQIIYRIDPVLPSFSSVAYPPAFFQVQAAGCASLANLSVPILVPNIPKKTWGSGGAMENYPSAHNPYKIIMLINS
jgi:hypothetical protein